MQNKKVQCKCGRLKASTSKMCRSCFSTDAKSDMARIRDLREQGRSISEISEATNISEVILESYLTGIPKGHREPIADYVFWPRPVKKLRPSDMKINGCETPDQRAIKLAWWRLKNRKSEEVVA